MVAGNFCPRISMSIWAPIFARAVETYAIPTPQFKLGEIVPLVTSPIRSLWQPVQRRQEVTPNAPDSTRSSVNPRPGGTVGRAGMDRVRQQNGPLHDQFSRAADRARHHVAHGIQPRHTGARPCSGERREPLLGHGGRLLGRAADPRRSRKGLHLVPRPVQQPVRRRAARSRRSWTGWTARR